MPFFPHFGHSFNTTGLPPFSPRRLATSAYKTLSGIDFTSQPGFHVIPIPSNLSQSLRHFAETVDYAIQSKPCHNHGWKCHIEPIQGPGVPDEERGSSGSQPVYYPPSPPPQAAPSAPTLAIDKQTITIGAVCVLLAFLFGACSGVVGMAFSLGGKSASLDTLTVEVQGMRQDMKDLNKQYTDNEMKSSSRISILEQKVEGIQNEVTEIRVQLQSQGLRH